ncbi:hypothetical protein L210DRAFT_3535236, partial [Boletus edulis BED1]
NCFMFMQDHASGSLLVEECGVSLRIRGVNLSTLALGEVMGRIMVSLLRARTSMARFWLVCSRLWRR